MGRIANMKRDSQLKKMAAKVEQLTNDARGQKLLSKLITHTNSSKASEERRHAQKAKYCDHMRKQHPVIFCVSATAVRRDNDHAEPYDKHIGFYTSYDKAKADLPNSKEIVGSEHLFSSFRVACAESSKVANKSLLRLDERNQWFPAQ